MRRKPTTPVSPPAVAVTRKTAFKAAIRSSLQRAIDSGEQITRVSIIASAAYDDGKAVNRTTLYAKDRSGKHVHQDLIDAIGDAIKEQAKQKRRVTSPSSESIGERPTAPEKALIRSLTNELVRTREELKLAELSNSNCRKKHRTAIAEMLLLTYSLFELSQNQSLEVRRKVSDLQRQIGNSEEDARLKSAGLALAKRIRETSFCESPE